MKLGDWLKEQNLTLTEFARRIGRPQATISRYVNGERIPEPEIMVLIHEATHGAVSADDFYDLKRRRVAS